MIRLASVFFSLESELPYLNQQIAPALNPESTVINQYPDCKVVGSLFLIPQNIKISIQ